MLGEETSATQRIRLREADFISVDTNDTIDAHAKFQIPLIYPNAFNLLSVYPFHIR